MRDLIFVGYLGLLFLMAFRRPFLFVPAYIYIDVIAPQRLSYYMLNALPISMVSFGLLALAWLFAEPKKDMRFGIRQIAMLVLLLYTFYTLQGAVAPIRAQEKWDWASKAMFFAFFLPLFLHKRLRFEIVIFTMVICASALIVTGGIKTIASGGGGGYGALVLLVDNNTGLYEGSIISCMAIALIPLMWWLVKYNTIFPKHWLVSAYAVCLTLSCLLIPVGTQARTGLICIAVLFVLMLRFAKRRMLYITAVGFVGLAAIPFLPASFTQRMSTIQDYQADESASTRIAVWKWTWEFAKENPTGGGFESYLINSVRYEMPSGGAVSDEGPQVIEDEGRAFHSSYFEMLGEHGFPGLFLWLFIFVGGAVKMELMRRRYAKENREGEEWIAPLAGALFNFHVIYLVGCLFVGIAFQSYALNMTAIAMGLETYVARRRQEASRKTVRQVLQRRPSVENVPSESPA